MVLNISLMIEVDDSDLTQEEQDYLAAWAQRLGVSLGVLAARILQAAVDGDQYVAQRPD